MFSIDLEIPDESFLGTAVIKYFTQRGVYRITFTRRRWLEFNSFLIYLLGFYVFS